MKYQPLLVSVGFIFFVSVSSPANTAPKQKKFVNSNTICFDCSRWRKDVPTAKKICTSKNSPEASTYRMNCRKL
jgi:hypothetical protein